jgi:hypothetical protein
VTSAGPPEPSSAAAVHEVGVYPWKLIPSGTWIDKGCEAGALATTYPVTLWAPPPVARSPG